MPLCIRSVKRVTVVIDEKEVSNCVSHERATQICQGLIDTVTVATNTNEVDETPALYAEYVIERIIAYRNYHTMIK